ncbi:iron-containing redox enzyme family protein [Haliangium ochraceum]|uniref:Iron-containing redox enzyme family protein n=1 Tax=Haliangium ochraceum (strain DSM 14365 / JCM 11303 / SMP-2) TaxID=502025 RepID=D0LUS2_HALO1|nr:iron-containing redox enzyme family protein [Haliangium ochraceum]ACY13962.1 hypothetical protein Hoch_1408 [Haliangium ochraceum DSM 14365]
MNHSEANATTTRPSVLDPHCEQLIDHAAGAGAWVLQSISVIGYHEILKNLYHVVMDSVPLMQHAAGILEREQSSGDDYLGRYRDYLRHHIEEESGHDIWLLEDLEALHGAGIESDERPVNEHLARMMAGHWHALHGDNPWLLLGHMWALESRPPSARGLRALRERLGLSAAMTHAYEHHAVADPEHARGLATLIAEPALSEEIRADITLGARITATGVARFWLELGKRYGLMPAA